MPADLQTELDAILHRAAIAPLDDRAFLRVTGSDATRWLNGMVTNSVQALAPCEGCYNFLLNAQGRILGDCTIYREPEPAEPASYLLATQSSQLETLRQHLDHFIIMDDVELTPGLNIDSTRIDKSPIGLALIGARTTKLFLKSLVGRHESIFEDAPRSGTMTFASMEGNEVIVLTPTTSSVPQYEVWCWNRSVIKELYRVWEFYKAIPISPEALEAFRILEARPLYGCDITDKYLPQETNQPHALHFVKGCYLGQEIVERIRSRGQVHRLLTPLTLTGSLPAELPTPLESEGKPAGEITSAALVPLPGGPQLLALGYVRREALDTHAALTYTGGSAAPRNATNN